MFDWQEAFQNKNINENVIILAETLMKIFKIFISNKTKIFDYRYPKWMNSLIIFYLENVQRMLRFHDNQA